MPQSPTDLVGEHRREVTAIAAGLFATVTRESHDVLDVGLDDGRLTAVDHVLTIDAMRCSAPCPSRTGGSRRGPGTRRPRPPA